MENMNSVSYYMGLPYNLFIKEIQDESGKYFYGKVLELEGCQSTGDTFVEAYESLREAMEGYIEVKLEHNISIPEPVAEDDYSGKFVVRIPKSLHKRLTVEAQQEGISLNQYAMYKLSK